MRPGFFWCKGNRAGVWHGMGMRSLNGESDRKGKMKEKLRLAVFGHKRWSREGGVEIVVEELATRMAAQGHAVTCYNRGGHHVSGAAYDGERLSEYKGVRLKNIPTIDKKGLAAVSASSFSKLSNVFGNRRRGRFSVRSGCFSTGGRLARSGKNDGLVNANSVSSNAATTARRKAFNWDFARNTSFCKSICIPVHTNGVPPSLVSDAASVSSVIGAF